MVPRTELVLIPMLGQFSPFLRSTHFPALKSASDGSSLRSKARTDAVLRSVLAMILLLGGCLGCGAVLRDKFDVAVVAAVKALFGIGLLRPQQLFKALDAMRADPFAARIQAFNKTEGRSEEHTSELQSHHDLV